MVLRPSVSSRTPRLKLGPGIAAAATRHAQRPAQAAVGALQGQKVFLARLRQRGLLLLCCGLPSVQRGERDLRPVWSRI
jgi:hypothetical protein